MLKLIALILMTVDHVAFVFVPTDSALYFLMRTIGRTVAPVVMCLFISEGFHYTRNRLKYLLRMAAFAVIAQPFYFMMIFGRLPINAAEFLTYWNVLYTFCVSILILMVITNAKINIGLKVFITAFCFILSLLGDWGLFIPVWVLIFHFCRDIPFKRKAAVFTVVTAFMIVFFSLSFFQYGVLFSVIPLYLYNGKRGGEKLSPMVSKWAVYLYYPAHMAAIVAVKFLLN